MTDNSPEEIARRQQSILDLLTIGYEGLHQRHGAHPLHPMFTGYMDAGLQTATCDGLPVYRVYYSNLFVNKIYFTDISCVLQRLPIVISKKQILVVSPSAYLDPREVGYESDWTYDIDSTGLFIPTLLAIREDLGLSITELRKMCDGKASNLESLLTGRSFKRSKQFVR